MYEYGDDDAPSRWRKLFKLVIVAALAAGGWFVVRPRLVDGESSTRPLFDTAVTTSTALATTEPATTEPATTEPATTERATTTTRSSTTTSTTSTTLAPPTTSTPSTVATTGSFASLPDGSPVPAVVILDDERLALAGALPDQQAVDALHALVRSINEFPNAPVVDQLTLDPNVPVGVGVRFLELNSALFPEDSPDVLPDHARQLDRVVVMMTTYPNVTAVIVGHADQRGSNEENLLLSRQRAEAIVAYLVSRGIDGARLSARAVGEADLLSINDDEASLALNRRSELIIYGLFVPATPPSTSIATTSTAP